MSELLLSAETGRTDGTRPSRRLRREGKIPAIVYGLDADPVAVAVDWPALRLALTTDAGLNALITLQIDGEEHLSVIKDLQRHPVRRDVIHVDFLRVRADQEIEVDVPISLEGEALEVTRADGMVDQIMYSLTISVKPTDVPEKVSVDISTLEIGGSIKVSDINLPAGVATSIDPEEVIASALITRSTLEAIAEAEAADLDEADLLAGGEEAAEGDDEAAGDGDSDD